MDVQLLKHEEYIKKFTGVFHKIDSDITGTINRNEFKLLIKEMNLRITDFERNKLLEKVDPYHNEKITFSECVSLFMYE